MKQYENEIKTLKSKVSELNFQLNKYKAKEKLTNTEFSDSDSLIMKLNQFDESINNIDSIRKLHYSTKSELDIYSYSAFTLDKWFPAKEILYKRNVERLTGDRLKDLHIMINYGLDYLNKNLYIDKYELKDFQIGFYRVTPFEGYEYDLFFKYKNKCCSMITINKPVKSLEIKASNLLDVVANDNQNNKEIINFIVPLWGDRLNAFKLFLNLFELVVIRQDNGFSTLTFVFLYNESSVDQQNLKSLYEKHILDFKIKTNFNNIKFISVNSDAHSRAKALEIGVETCCNYFENNNQNNELLFFCDVDIVFTQKFLDLCRYNTEKSKKVYYPILFSFYNKNLTDKLNNIDYKPNTSPINGSILSINLTINVNTGFWRDFGFGMTCQYKSDFLKVNGFYDFKQLNSWGDEDLFLYRKYVNNINGIKIVRQITPFIYHLYHEKICNQNSLNHTVYQHCLESKILNEASHRHFGLLYFNYSMIKR